MASSILERLRRKLTWQWGWKRRESPSGYLFVCSLPRERSTKRGAIECKVLVFSPTFLQAQKPPPPSPPPTTPRGETSRNPHQIRRWHIKNRVAKKKAVMVAKDVAAVLVFYWALSIAPLSIGVVSEGDALSGLPCRSEIWSWRLCDSLGWGIAVSAEKETQSWSMGLPRQAYVQRSYGMVPLRCSKGSSLHHFLAC